MMRSTSMLGRLLVATALLLSPSLARVGPVHAAAPAATAQLGFGFFQAPGVLTYSGTSSGTIRAGASATYFTTGGGSWTIIVSRQMTFTIDGIGGGGGGGGNATSDSGGGGLTSGGGGGGGGAFRATSITLQSGKTYTLIVGAAGAHGVQTTEGTAAGAGGETSLYNTTDSTYLARALGGGGGTSHSLATVCTAGGSGGTAPAGSNLTTGGAGGCGGVNAGGAAASGANSDGGGAGGGAQSYAASGAGGNGRSTSGGSAGGASTKGGDGGGWTFNGVTCGGGGGGGTWGGALNGNDGQRGCVALTLVSIP